MTAKEGASPDKRTGQKQSTQRSGGNQLSGKQIKELELAGGVEGGMEAGSAGGPSQQDAERRNAAKSPAR